jgi:hypothetical protein
MKQNRLLILFVLVLFICAVTGLNSEIYAYDQSKMQKALNKLCPPGKVHMKDSFKSGCNPPCNSQFQEPTNTNVVIIFPKDEIITEAEAISFRWSDEARAFTNEFTQLVPCKQQKDIKDFLIEACALIAGAPPPGTTPNITSTHVKTALLSSIQHCMMHPVVKDILLRLPDAPTRDDLIAQLRTRSIKRCTD